MIIYLVLGWLVLWVLGFLSIKWVITVHDRDDMTICGFIGWGLFCFVPILSGAMLITWLILYLYESGFRFKCSNYVVFKAKRK